MMCLSSGPAPPSQPYQERNDPAEYRVVYSPHVAVRDKPWGKVVGSIKCGEMFKTTHRSVGLSDGIWVKTQQKYGGEPGWMLVDGKSVNLPLLLEKYERGRQGRVNRYRVVSEHCDIRERPSLAGTPVVGKRSKGAVIRTDMEMNGWVRLQADFYTTGKAEPVEGWSLIAGSAMGLGLILQLWEPPNLPPVTIGSVGALGNQTKRFWVVSDEGTVVRERPWGKVLCTRTRGMLLRCDMERDGWARLEADFTEEEGILERVPEDEDAMILEGWVLIDGRDLGLPRQLQKYNKEKVPPPGDPKKSAVDMAERRRVKHAAHKLKLEDFSLATILTEAKVSEEVLQSLLEAGVDDFEELITVVSRADHHEELKRCGIGKLGARAKLATLVQPYWKALSLKDQGNAKYKDSRFEDAATLYTKAIQMIPCQSTDLALNCYSNRAACFQQMREPDLAKKDVEHVLRFDPSNEKALARKKVYDSQLAGM